MAQTTSTTVTNVVQTYIRDQAIIPLQYAIPMLETAAVYRMPRAGVTLRIPRLRELSSSTGQTDLWTSIGDGGSDILHVGDTNGRQALNIDYDEYTMEKYGTFLSVTDKASYSSLLDLSDAISRTVANVMGRAMTEKAQTALIDGGLQWLIVQSASVTNANEANGITASGTHTTTATQTDNAEINDYWNLGMLVCTSGKNAGLAREISDFANSNGAFTHAAFPQAAADNDTFNVAVLGNGTSSGPDDIAATDTMSLKELYRAAERCRRFGAGAMRGPGPRLTVTGIKRDNSADVAAGVAFMPTPIAHDLKITLQGNAATTDQYFQTSEGFRRVVGGKVSRVGGILVVETNYNLRKNITNGDLSTTAGVGWPTFFLFQDCWGTTTLKDNPGNRQGLSVTVKMPKKTDPAILYDSEKMRTEAYVINKYFVLNALHGVVLWAGTSTA